jgi:apolipoprotein N-acyltransferase
MNPNTESSPAPQPVAPALNPLAVLGLGGASVVMFHLAWIQPRLGPLILLFVAALVGLSRARTGRQAFYSGLAVGFAAYAPHLWFFWGIFGWPSVILWGILAFWLGLFAALVRSVRVRGGRLTAAVLIPFLWTGLEFFRSELYYLRFSWLSVGYAFAGSPQVFRVAGLGVYGVGFALAAVTAGATLLPRRRAMVVLGSAMLVPAALAFWPMGDAPSQGRVLKVAGVQLEFPAPQEVPDALDRLVREHPDAELLVLSEYTFDGPVPERVKAWCRQNRRYLVSGGKDPLAGSDFYNTVFVVGPEGEVVFQQVKSVPIQFFKDGSPATARVPWNSPWGKIGLCVCYDLSYRRVVDDLVRQGAQALIVPTMDVVDWGAAQHQLHARIGPVRAAEYGVPLFRLCSSGISQWVDASGRVQASAPYPGQGAALAGTLELNRPGHLPLDRFLAPASTGIASLTLAILAGMAMRNRLRTWLVRRAQGAIQPLVPELPKPSDGGQILDARDPASAIRCSHPDNAKKGSP